MAAYKLCEFWIQRWLHHNFNKNWENSKVTETLPGERWEILWMLKWNGFFEYS